MKLQKSHIDAVFYKECRDAIKNKSIVLMLFIFPVFTFVFNLLAGDEDISIILPSFLTMHVIMTPMSTMSSIIAEEKDKNTLRTLLVSNVSPLEYLIGIGTVIELLIVLSSLFFIPVLYDFRLSDFPLYISVVILVSLCSIIIGAVIGMISKNQMSVGPISVPLSSFISMTPLFAIMNEKYSVVSKYLYSQVAYDIFYNITDKVTKRQLVVSFINFVIAIIIFCITFKRARFDN